MIMLSFARSTVIYLVLVSPSERERGEKESKDTKGTPYSLRVSHSHCQGRGSKYLVSTLVSVECF